MWLDYGEYYNSFVEQFKDKIGEANHPVDGEDGARVGLQEESPIVEPVVEFAVDPGVLPWRDRGAVRPLQTCVEEFECESVDGFVVDPGVSPWRAEGAVSPLQTCIGEFRRELSEVACIGEFNCELSEAIVDESDRTRHVGSTRPKNRWSEGRRLEERSEGTGSLKAMSFVRKETL